MGQLAGRFQRVVTTVEAGAGFGKTSLIGQALAEAEELDQSTELLVRARPRSARWEPEDAVIAEVAELLGCDNSVEAIADAVLSAAPRPVALWIDDVHHLADASRPDRGSAIGRLVRLLPANGHLILVGRRLPALALSRLDLEGLVLRLDEEELRFDLDERAAFLEMRGQTSDAVAAEMASGWPAIMELEAVAGQPGAAEYLTQEVLGELPPDRLAALRALALVEVADQAMLSAITDYQGSIDELIAGLPLVSASRDGGSVAAVVLHDLLRETLLAGLTEVEVREVERAIGLELLGQGDLAGAARRLGEIDDIHGVEQVAMRLLEDMHVATVVGDRTDAVAVVEDVLGDALEARALRGVTLVSTEPMKAEPVLIDAIASARAGRRDDIEAICTVRLADAYYGRGELTALSRLRNDLARLAAAGEPTAQRLGFQLDCWVLRLSGQDAEIVDLIDGLIDDNDLDDEMMALAVSHRTLGLAYSGRIRQAMAEADQHADLLPPGLYADRIRGFLTIQHWMLGQQTDEIRQRAMRLVDRIEGRGQTHLFVEGAATTAVFAASVGDLSSAGDLVARAERGAELLPPGAWAHHSLAQARAVVQLLTGEEGAAATTLEQAMPAAGPFDRLPRHIYGLTGALSYVLVPRSRQAWDDANIGGDLALRLEVARALVAFRERGDTAPAAALPWADAHLLRPWAFGPHLAELAVAAMAAGEDQAAGAIDGARYDSIDVLERLEAKDDKPVSVAARQAIQATPRRPAEVIEIGLFGPLSVCRGGVEEADTPAWSRARVRDLISLLAHERVMPRQAAAEALWPDKTEKAGQNNLRSNLSYLLTALEPGRTGTRPSWFIRTSGDKLSLDGGDQLVLDVDRFEAARAEAVALDGQAPRRALIHHLAVCDLYRGDFLAGSSLEEYAYFEAMRRRGDYVASATRAADLLVSLGEPDRAETLAFRACEVEPLHEPLRRALAATLFAQRRFGAARDVLGSLLSELAKLDIPPEPETVAAATRLGLET